MVEKHPEMVLRSWRPFRFPQGAASRTNSSSPTKSHTNFKGLITPDLGCFLAVSQVRKSQSLSLSYVRCWGGRGRKNGAAASFWKGRVKQNSQLGRLSMKVRSYKEKVGGGCR